MTQRDGTTDRFRPANKRRGTPPAHDVPLLMAELVAWINQPGDVHPVLVLDLDNQTVALLRLRSGSLPKGALPLWRAS